MGCVTGCEAAVDHQALALQACDRPARIAVDIDNGIELNGPIGQHLPGSELFARTRGHQDFIVFQPEGKAVVAAAWAGGQLLIQGISRLRVQMAQQAQWHHSARSDFNAGLSVEADLTVTTKADRNNPHRFHHGFPVTNAHTIAAQFRPPTADHRNISGGSTHIGNDRVADATQGTGANDAGRRAGQNRTHRLLQGCFRVDQGTIAFDHHQRRMDIPFQQDFLHREDQFMNDRHHARIERHGQRPSGRIQIAGQFVTAGDRPDGRLFNQVAKTQLVGRIAHAKHG